MSKETVPPPVQNPLSRTFVLGGNAIFTIDCEEGKILVNGRRRSWLREMMKRGRKPQPYYTYHVKYDASNLKYAPTYWVRLLKGPDDPKESTYLGILDDFSLQLRLTASSVLRSDALAVQVLNRTLARVESGDHDAIARWGFRLIHEGRCGACGRGLRERADVACGFHAACLAKGGK